LGDFVQLPDGRSAEVLDVYDDEVGREGDVKATLVVDQRRTLSIGAGRFEQPTSSPPGEKEAVQSETQHPGTA
jgi:hypothetical protein